MKSAGSEATRGGKHGVRQFVSVACATAVAAFVLVGVESLRSVTQDESAEHIDAPDLLAPVRAAGREVRFEANRGQTHADVRFVSRGKGYTLFLAASEAVVALVPRADATANAPGGTVRMRLLGGSREPRIEGLERLPGTSNYLLGEDPGRWATGVPSFARVRYSEVYAGIDAIYYGDEQGRLEYDFVVAPGADPRVIAMEFRGGEGLSIDASGELVVATRSGELRHKSPTVYQTVSGSRRLVDARYVLKEDDVAAFEFGAYDPSHPLVIDPVMVYSTYLGGGGEDAANAIATDAKGNVYVAGYTTSTDFPVERPYDDGCGTDDRCDPTSNGDTNPNNVRYSLQPDVFVTKLAPDGERIVYSTYIGGRGDDRATGIAIDGDSNAYISGGTTSPDFPVTKDSAFDPDCGSDGKCNFRATDATGDDPSNGHVKADMFLIKLDSGGAKNLYATYIGGSGDDGRPQPLLYQLAASNPTEPGDPYGPRLAFAGGVAVYGKTAYVVGPTLSEDLKKTLDAADPHCGTGAERDCNRFYCEQKQGCPPPSGNAQTNDPRGMLRYFPDAHLAVVDTEKTELASLRYSSYFGGSGPDIARDVAVALVGGHVRAYITGNTSVQKFPGFADDRTINPLSNPPVPEPYPTKSYSPERPAFQLQTRVADVDMTDAFVTAVDFPPQASSVAWSTFLGGWGDSDAAFSVGTGPDGAPWITGSSSACDDPKTTARYEGFPTTRNAFQEKNSRLEASCSFGFGDEDAIVSGLDAYGSRLVYSSFLGASGSDAGRGVAVDGRGHLHVTGTTNSTAFPRRAALPTPESLTEPDATAFVAKLRPDGGGNSDLEYSTYLGGLVSAHPTGTNSSDEARGLALSEHPARGTTVHVTGFTASSDFPRQGGVQAEHAGVTDGFVATLAERGDGPVVYGLAPSTGSSAGGTEVVIAGAGFSASSTVTFGSRTAVPKHVSSDGSALTVITPPGAGRVDVTVRENGTSSPPTSLGRFSYVDGAWGPGGSPGARSGHTATLLTGPNCNTTCGKVLVVGGVTNGSNDKVSPSTSLSSAYLYDASAPGGPAWSDASCPTILSCPGRTLHTATQLLDGTVLVVGGKASGGLALTSTHLYRPPGPNDEHGTWEEVGNTVIARMGHSATLLTGSRCGANCGKVLVVGGIASGTGDNEARRASRTAELYDPQKPKGERWSLAAPPVDEHGTLHTATMIPDGHDCRDCGKVLLLGGTPQLDDASDDSSPSAELYDPAAGVWVARTNVVARYSHSVSPIAGGKLLIAGGISEVFVGNFTSDGQPGRALGTAELYDPRAPFDQAFSLTKPLQTPRSGHAAVALPDGRAAVIGGAGDIFRDDDVARPTLASVEVFDPLRGEWRQGASLSTARGDRRFGGAHTATVLSRPHCTSRCEDVLVLGGLTRPPRSIIGGEARVVGTSELYTPGPYITTLEPPTGRPEGGTQVVISGSGFVARGTPASEVRFADRAAPGFTVLSSNQIATAAPPMAGGANVDVAVIVPGLGMATSPAPFRYEEAAGRITDLVADVLSGTEVLLRFTAVGFPPATDYVVKQARTPLTEATFAAAKEVCGGGVCTFSPRNYRDPLTVSVGGLTPETTYYYAVRAKRSDGSLGPLSNVVEATTGNVTPSAVSDLVATVVDDGEVRLGFSAPGSNGADPPPARRFVVRQSLVPIVDADTFERAQALCDGHCVLEPGTVGEPLSLSVRGLTRDTTYHYALRALDEAGNLGPISNNASAAPGCVGVEARPGSVVYPAGYQLVGLPGGTRVPAQSVLYTWFNLGRGGRYAIQQADAPVASGQGYWAWFSCPRRVALAGGTASATSALTAYRASMLGNPSATSPAVVSGHDFAARWDASANGGRGGYQISGYREPQTLAVGEGIWAFSYRDTTIVVTAR